MVADDGTPGERDLSPDDRPSMAWPPSWSVRVVAETGSTNADLVAAASAGAPSRSALVAAHQTEGRGRFDRRWEAPPGANLLASILVDEPADRPGIGIRRLAVATKRACEEGAGVTVDLKWPNDLLVGDRKLAGLLGQRVDGDRVVIGVGVNVGWRPPGAACLGNEHDPLQLFRAVLGSWDSLPDDPLQVDAEYRQALITLGRRVRVELGPGRALVGHAVDLADGGRLVVDVDGERHELDAGDVIHLRLDGDG